tara:strand:- start:1763 stop:2662 length:900 start_codon:yes stop_codon:yes gene_type:complete
MMKIQTTPMNGLFDAEYFDLKSSIVNDTFRIFIGKPAGMQTDSCYPAIFTLDGNSSFASLLGTQRMLTMGGEVPEAIVVGIAYPGNTMWEAMANRNRDYAPSEPGESEIRALGAAVKPGAEAFLRFIREELKPLLIDHYPIKANDSTLLGVSLGGLFGVWTLLTAPETFNRYILASPAIWWRNQQVWEWEESYANRHKHLNATVFMGAGALEVTEHLRADALSIAERNPILKDQVNSMIKWNDEHGWPEVAKLVPALVAKLTSRNYDGLCIDNAIMSGENHMSAPPGLSSRGLRYVFRK